MLKHTPTPEALSAAEGILSAFESARTGSTDRPSKRAIVASLAQAITSTDSASELNKSIFSAPSMRKILNENKIEAKFPEPLSGERERVAFYSGITYGFIGNASATHRELPKSLIIEEKDKTGQDVSKEVAVATMRLYNYLTSAESSPIIGSGIADLKGTAQAIKCISQLIAANITSDQNILHGVLFAASAVGNHFYNRGLLALGTNSRTVANMAGLIFSAFAAKGENLAPLSEFKKPSTAALAVDESEFVSFEKVTGPTLPRVDQTSTDAIADADVEIEPEELHHKQNTHELTKEQCKLLSAAINDVVAEAKDLDTDLGGQVLVGIEAETLNRLGRDILEVQNDTESSVASLELASNKPKIQAIDVVQAVSHRLELTSSTEQLSSSYLELTVRALKLAKEGIIENGAWGDLSHCSIDKLSPDTLMELAEDILAEANDPMGSIEDMEPITAAHMKTSINLIECLDAFTFRLNSIAQNRA